MNITTGLKSILVAAGIMLAAAMPNAAAAQDGQTPADVQNIPGYTDCSQYPREGYDDEDGNDGRDGISSRALSRTPEQNAARLCNGLPVYTGDTRMTFTTTWNPQTRILMSVFGDRMNGGQQNGTTRMGWLTYPGSTTPMSATPMFIESAYNESGNSKAMSAAASVPSSFFNGTGAAIVNTAFSPCRGGRCNSGPQVVNLVDTDVAALSSSLSGSESNATIEGFGGTCSTCGVPAGSSSPAPSPAGDAPSAAMVNPSEQGIE